MKPTPSTHRRRAGFSLAELMVVIVIIGLLVGVVAPNVFRYLFSGQQARVRTDLIKIDEAIQNYTIENARPPEGLDTLVEPDENGQSYLQSKSIPKDPWGNEYQYDPPSGGDTYRLYSLGEDGQLGGEAKARDLDLSWARGEEEE